MSNTDESFSDWSPDLEKPASFRQICYKSPNNNVITRYVYFLTRTPTYDSIKDFLNTLLLITVLMVAFSVGSFTMMEFESLEAADTRYKEWSDSLTGLYPDYTPDLSGLWNPGDNISKSLIARGGVMTTIQFSALIILMYCYTILLLTVEADDPASTHAYWRVNGWFIAAVTFMFIASVYHFVYLQLVVIYIQYPDPVFKEAKTKWIMGINSKCSNGSRWESCELTAYSLVEISVRTFNAVFVVFSVILPLLIPCSQYEKACCSSQVFCPMSAAQVAAIEKNLRHEDKMKVRRTSTLQMGMNSIGTPNAKVRAPMPD